MRALALFLLAAPLAFGQVGGTQGGIPRIGMASSVGTPGTPGAAGQSAYQIAVSGGYTGTQAQWLASLQGATGSVAFATIRSVTTATDTLLASDCTSGGNSVQYSYAGNTAVTVPSPSGFTSGCLIRLKNLSGSGYGLTLTAASGTTIDGNASLTILYPGDGVLQYNGSTWTALGGYGVRGASTLTAAGPLTKVTSAGNIGPAVPGVDYIVPSLYTGLVATRTETLASHNASLTWMSNRSFHVARTAIAAGTMQIVWGNYWVTTSNVETSPGTATIQASVEYPAGTITVCTFAGSGTASVAGLADAITDPCGPAIPLGARFWIRALYTNSAGIIYNSLQTNHYSSSLEQNQYGTGTPTSCVSSGTCPNNTGSNSALGMPPLAIIGVTSAASVCLAGDSRMMGYQDATTDASGDTGEIARSVGPVLAYTKLAVGSTTGAQALTNFTNRMRMVGYCSHVVDEYGVNDKAQASASDATVASTRSSLATMFGKPTFGTTLPPETSSTDSWATTTNQTVTVSTTGFNALAIAGITGEVGVFDIDSVVDPLGLNLWPVSRVVGATSGTARFSTPDGIHENAVLNRIIAQSGVVNTNWIRR